MEQQKINHLAVVVCTVLSMLVPVIWYSIFADQWMQLNGLSEEFVHEHESTSMYIAALISGLIGSYLLAWLWQRMQIQSAKDGFLAGLAIGFGLLFLTGMIDNLFSHRAYALSWIDGGKSIIWTTVAGTVLGAWIKK